MPVKRAAKSTLAIDTGIAENGISSGDMFFVDPDEKIDGFSSAKTTLSRGLVKIGDENYMKELVAHCVLVA